MRATECPGRIFLQLSFHECLRLELGSNPAQFGSRLYFVSVRKHAWFRVLVAVWGLWFTAALSEAAGLHTCAMHGNHSVAHPAGAHASAGHPGHGTQKQVSKSCTCLGVCCGASIATPRFSLQPGIVPLQGETVAFNPDVAAPRVLREHELPFAIGPPSAI